MLLSPSSRSGRLSGRIENAFSIESKDFARDA